MFFYILFYIRHIYLNKGHIKVWNNSQKKIWLYIVKEELVNVNDTYLFIKFAEEFNIFVDRYHRCPSKKYMKNKIKKHIRKDNNE